jgi:hypothetical protein
MARRIERADNPANPQTAKQGGSCPICATPATEAYWPFCSRRCADVDLARWLGGAYVIPLAEHDDEDGEAISHEPPPGSEEIDQ